MAAGHCGKLAASLIVIHSPASVSVKGRKHDTFGGTCSTKYACMKRGRDCVRWCTHWGPQDHSVAMVTSGRRAQEAKAQDQSDGMRLRKKISDRQKRKSYIFINTEIRWSFTHFIYLFCNLRHKQRFFSMTSPKTKQPTSEAAEGTFSSFGFRLSFEAQTSFINLDFKGISFFDSGALEVQMLVVEAWGLINQIWRLDFMINDRQQIIRNWSVIWS